MTSFRRLTGRQITVIVAAVCLAVVATPVAALAAAASFSSTSASTPAVSAKNTSSGSGAKAVYGNASASGGTTYGVYGHASSASGYGIYSAGRLGTSGALVCSHCVTGGDVNTATLPTVPDASNLGGHSPGYYARLVPLSSTLANDDAEHILADVDGLRVDGLCGGGSIELGFVRDTAPAPAGTLNYFTVTGSTASASGTPLSTTEKWLPASSGTTQTEGSAIYRDDATGRIITISFHLYGANCELFGDVMTTG